MANHLEDLICQFYDWKGCIVRRNVKVGRRARGGYEGELDVVIYDHFTNKVLHYEPSTDASSWAMREIKYGRKFAVGKKYVRDVFPWLPADFTLEQIAVFFIVPENRKTFQGGTAISIDALVGMICAEIRGKGRVGKNAIPEQYNLLRMAQLVISGYMKPWNSPKHPATI
jgi:hypothetical protein